MKIIKGFDNGNGTWDFYEWTEREMGDYLILKFFAYLFFGAFLSVIATTFFLFAKVYDYEANEKKPSFFGIIIGIYYILDHYNNWFIRPILSGFCEPKTLTNMVEWNLGILLTMIMLVIFGDMIYYNEDSEDDEPTRKYMLSLYTVITFVVAYCLAILII